MNGIIGLASVGDNRDAAMTRRHRTDATDRELDTDLNGADAKPGANAHATANPGCPTEAPGVRRVLDKETRHPPNKSDG
jgi:hypothetical protein